MAGKIMRRLKLFSLLGGGAIAVAVLLQNTDSVPLRFLFWQLFLPKVILVLLSLILGAIIGLVLARSSWRN